MKCNRVEKQIIVKCNGKMIGEKGHEVCNKCGAQRCVE